MLCVYCKQPMYIAGAIVATLANYSDTQIIISSILFCLCRGLYLNLRVNKHDELYIVPIIFSVDGAM